MTKFTNARTINRPNFIGILGEDGAGKSTVAGLIEETLYQAQPEHFLDTERQAFAGELKRMVHELDPILGAHVMGTRAEEIRLSDLLDDGYTEAEIKAKYPEYRRVLRDLGTKCLRSRDPNFWVDTFTEQHMTHMPDGLVLIADDVRFANEADTIAWRTDLGRGAVIKVVGRGEGSGSGEQIGTAHHDAIIDNSGTLEETRAQIQEVLAHWGWKL